jgi:hypothetical protein
MSITVSHKTEDWDDEGREIGPVVVIDHDLYDKDPEIVKSCREGGFGIPFGYKPNGMTELGWRTRREALAVAAEHGVTLTEY